jgi:hypothetical protein
MNKDSFRKAGHRWGLIAGIAIICFLLYTSIFSNMVLRQDEQGFSYIAWVGPVSATENSTIGATASGFLEIFFLNVSATPTTTYGTAHNTSSLFETWANASLDPDGSGPTYYAYAKYGGFSLTLKWGTAIQMVVRYRGNVTNAKNATIFNAANCRVKVNATGGGCTTLTSQVLTNVVSYNQTGGTFIWINAYYNIGTLNKGGTYTITNIKIEFNY